MPELPEVERGRRIAEQAAHGRVISRIRLARDPIVFDGVGAARFRKALLGRTVLEVGRRGKQIWFELDRTPWPLFHFGMTGAFRLPGDHPLELASSPKHVDASWPPRFTKIHLHFDDGGELVMTNARRLGRILLREDPMREAPIADLGFDPLLDLPASGKIAQLLVRRKGRIKAVLLDQSFAAGVGNWIADEVLYQAGIDPRRRAHTLSAEEVQRMRRKLKQVIDTAVRVNADKKKFPAGWLFHRRWGKEKGAATASGEKIRHITVGGRTTAWVPARQS
ncbi:MAG: hypothetical protein CMJ18_24395 [Phycisphaeraceae bacterium]|nr:hypothetical protein [Phycisphaeraceae bacterium]